MRTFVTIGIALFSLGITGCKVAITAPPSGTVATVSGDYLCQADTVCDIDVGSEVFVEEFIATPAEGYEFRWWRGGDRALCGTASSSCLLSNEALLNLDWGQAILASAEAFYLQPVFTAPHGSTPLEDVNASACFNGDAWQEGFSVTLRYRQLQLENQPTHLYKRKVLGERDFNNHPAIAVQTTIRDAATKNPQSTQTSFFSVNTSEPSIKLLGVTISGNIDANGNAIYTPGRYSWYDFAVGPYYDSDNYNISYDGAVPRLFKLNKDESYHFDYVRHIVPEQLTSDSYTAINGTIRYEGMQNVTVPAGEFEYSFKRRQRGTGRKNRLDRQRQRHRAHRD